MRIKEAIVVEGKDDISAVKKAVDAELIETAGIQISKRKLEEIKDIYSRQGIIIFTDPDYAGERIREILTGLCPGAKQAFLARDLAEKDGDIGIENASPEAIVDALKGAKASLIEPRSVFTRKDLMDNGLMAKRDSKKKREDLGRILKIGYGNSKQFLSRLNSLGVSREEFEGALEELDSNG